MPVEGRLTGLRLRVLAAADELADATADHSVATWLAAESHTDPRAQAGDLALARALEMQEGKALKREERRAAAVTTLSLRRNGDGTTRVTGRLPDPVADRLRAYLDAYTSPRRHAGGTEGDRPPSRRRLGEAFSAFLEHVDPRRTP
jgi:hypothetical protein